MTIVSGAVHSVNTMDGYAGAVSSLQVAQVLFTVSGTYAQADDGQLLTVNALIQNSRRNGKTVTLVDAMCGSAATKASDPSDTLGLSGVSVSSTTVLFTITDGDFSTEFADATAVPTQARPFAVLVSFTEA
jgi:hypothetical protein